MAAETNVPVTLRFRPVLAVNKLDLVTSTPP
jgi:hypothetical protein